MGKGKKNRNYKVSPISCIEEGLGVLGNLIMSTIWHLEKYVAYAGEVDNIISQSVTLDENTKDVLEMRPVPEDVFHNLNDKLMYRQMMILKLFADEQSASFSYRNVRKLFKKLGYLKGELPQEISQTLNELLDIRNWTFHNPQSLYTAQKEVMTQSIPGSFRSIVSPKPQTNPVYITINNFFDVTYLCSLSLHTETRIKQFSAVLDNMKKDYKEMYQKTKPQGIILFRDEVFDSRDVQFRIYREEQPKGLLDTADLTAQISMAIQKGKYDGTDEVFHKWTLNRLKDND